MEINPIIGRIHNKIFSAPLGMRLIYRRRIQLNFIRCGGRRIIYSLVCNRKGGVLRQVSRYARDHLTKANRKKSERLNSVENAMHVGIV